MKGRVSQDREYDVEVGGSCPRAPEGYRCPGGGQGHGNTGVARAQGDEPAAVVELGFDTFVFWPVTDAANQLELFATRVVPAVRERVADLRRQA